MLEVRDLSVSFTGGPDALVDVSVKVQAREILAISGEPGSGKSALARCMAGDLIPTRGRVLWEGTDLNHRRRQHRESIAIVWQDLALCDTLDVAANLMLGREQHMLSDARFYAEATDELAELGIPIADTTVPVRKLTIGQRRLLALAMALGCKPKLLIVDELTASLGTRETGTVERLLLAARQGGTTIAIVTRDVEQMFRICDRIVMLAHGRIVAELDPATSHRDDVAAMLGEEAAIAHREAAALRRSQELQRQFLSRLSHELRTPLTAIRGYASSLSAPDVTWDQDSQQRFLERIATESARLGRLVDDLLDFSAIESGVMRLQPDWCDLNLVINAAVSLLPGDWPGAVRVCCDVDVPPIWADHDRLEQIFVNLLFNAFKHNGPGVHVTIAGRPSDNDRVEITVSDDGPGFPAALRENPFDSGRRPQSRTAGAGLGLSIAKGIVEAHGGTIELVPDDGQPGTSFQIKLPIETVESDESLQGPPLLAHDQPVPGAHDQLAGDARTAQVAHHA